MLKITEFDVKTGIDLQEFDPETQELQLKQKQIEHSFLEHWFRANRIENAQFFLGKFYDRVTDADRQRLEADGKVLVFSNGRTGYFTDSETAQLLTRGDSEQRIPPIYAADRNTAHNAVAYGSLIVSDGMSSTLVDSATTGHNVRVLVIDDEARSWGRVGLQDRHGRSISIEDLNKLCDKMGDGTMLVATPIMKALLTEAEIEQAIVNALEKAGVKADIAELISTYQREGTLKSFPIPVEVSEAIDKHLNYLTHTTVTQFRAATLDLPGMVKGTMATSRWCERLGVNVILSKNDIKGDDGTLSEPGIKEVSQFWINRKSDGKYGEQVVGPQVKGCIPEATLTEFNPLLLGQIEALAEVAVDPKRLGQYYLDQKNKQRKALAVEGHDQDDRSDWLYDVLKADSFGQLDQFSKVNYELDRYLRGERVDLAVGGIYVPSAMAQNHEQLMPWEVCNKDLPHGAIVAYYRSPFPNVGAAAIAINNTETLKQNDLEAFRKEGVAYLNPWTAKQIAITDFDKDANGYFVGYLPVVEDLPNRIRAELATVGEQPSAEQYKAGRSLFGRLIAQMQMEPDQALICSGAFPVAVAEIIDRNAPDRKPPEVVKQQKVKHTWNQGKETLSQATWRAWEVTANNPTGKVANAGIILQSLALETQYIAVDQKEPLLVQISNHYKKLLEFNTPVPDDQTLTANGFPAYRFRERIDAIAQSTKGLPLIQAVEQRQQFVEEQLLEVHHLLTDIVDGPNAVNLQTAVDTAKSSKGIDESIQAFARALAHKPHELRQHQKDTTIYTSGKLMPTNTQEPIGWGVEAVNQFYEATQLSEYPNEAFRDLFPKDFTSEQEEKALAIVETYNSLVKQAIEAKERLREKRPEDQQPTLILTSPKTGKQLTLQRICDVNSDDSSDWQTTGKTDWQTFIEANPNITKNNPERFIVQRVLKSEKGTATQVPLGFISPESAAEHNFEERLKQHHHIPVSNPVIQLCPPLVLQSDTREQLAKAAHHLQAAAEAIPAEERMAYASAMWRQSSGMGIVLKAFTQEVCQQLQAVPELTLTGIQRDTNKAGRIPDGEYTVRFSQYDYETKEGETRTAQSIAIVEMDGTEKQFGAIDPRSVRLPIGTTCKAEIATPLADKVTAQTQSGAITIKKVLEGGLQNRTWQAESATLYVGYQDSSAIAQVEVDGLRKTLGIIDPASERKLKNSGALQPGRFQKAQAVLNREPGNIVHLQVVELVAQPLARSLQHLGNYVDGRVVPFSQAQIAQAQPVQAKPESPPITPEQGYAPSRQELLDWYTAVKAREDVSRLEGIKALGNRLRQFYNQEQGNLNGNASPPPDFRSSEVTISVNERKTMRRDVTNFRSAIGHLQAVEKLQVTQAER